MICIGASAYSTGGDAVSSTVVDTAGTPVEIGIECVGLVLEKLDPCKCNYS
jgi:hypothetical protein